MLFRRSLNWLLQNGCKISYDKLQHVIQVFKINIIFLLTLICIMFFLRKLMLML